MSKIDKVYIVTAHIYISDGVKTPYEVAIFDSKDHADDWVMEKTKDEVVGTYIQEIESMIY